MSDFYDKNAALSGRLLVGTIIVKRFNRIKIIKQKYGI